MNILTSRRWSVALGGLALWAASGAANADSTWWTTSCTDGAKTCTKTADGVSMTATAYSSDGVSTNFSNSGAAFTALEQWGGGIGIISSDPNDSDESSGSSQPDHAIDNDPYPGADYNEMVHLSFSEAIDLASVTAGWTYYDSDAMIFRWDNAGTTPTITSFSPTSVMTAGSGWTLVASQAFAGGSGGGTINISSSQYSSHWLVSTAFGGAGDGKDGFKLEKFVGSVKPPSGGGGPVPEPGTLSLALLGVLGIAGRKRAREFLSRQAI